MNLKSSFFLFFLASPTIAFSMESSLDNVLLSLEKSAKTSVRYKTYLTQLKDFLKHVDELETISESASFLMPKINNIEFKDFPLLNTFEVLLSSQGSTEITSEGTKFIPYDPQKSPTFLKYIYLITTPEGIAAYVTAVEAIKNLLSNDLNIPDFAKIKEATNIGYDLQDCASNREVNFIGTLLLHTSFNRLLRFLFYLASQLDEKIKQVTTTTLLPSDAISGIKTAFGFQISPAERLIDAYNLNTTMLSYLTVWAPYARKAVDSWHTGKEKFELPSGIDSNFFGPKITKIILGLIQESTKNLQNTKDKRINLTQKVTAELNKLEFSKPPSPLQRPSSSKGKKKRKKKKKQPKASLTTPVNSTPLQDSSSNISTNSIDITSFSSVFPAEPSLSNDSKPKNKSSTIKSVKKSIPLKSEKLLKYDKRLQEYLLGAQSEALTARDDISSQHYHAFHFLVDLFVKKFGIKTKRPNRTNLEQLDTHYSLPGMIRYSKDNSERLVIFSFTSDRKGWTYHRDIKKFKNIQELLQYNNVLSTISEYQQDNLEELSEEKRINLYSKFSNAKNSTSQLASYKETDLTIIIKDKLHNCTYYLFKSLKNNAEGS